MPVWLDDVQIWSLLDLAIQLKSLGAPTVSWNAAHLGTTFGTSPKDKINLTHYKIGFNASTTTLDKLKQHKDQMISHKKNFNLNQGNRSSAASVKRVTMATFPQTTAESARDSKNDNVFARK